MKANEFHALVQLADQAMSAHADAMAIPLHNLLAEGRFLGIGEIMLVFARQQLANHDRRAVAHGVRRLSLPP